MNVPAHTPTAMADRVAAHLLEPPPRNEPWTGQSLAEGPVGTALLHIERALTGYGTRRTAHRWLTAAIAEPISVADSTGLYLGAPAVAFVLHTAAADTESYIHAHTTLSAHVADLAHHRARTALERISRGEPTTFAEYDVFHGITGIGAYLLSSDPGGTALEHILDYLVALTRPIKLDGLPLPGWWVNHDPRRGTSPHFPGGHANLGAAHGITGPLLLLGQAMRRGVTVDGHREAIAVICAHLDEWKQHSDQGPWWPEHLTTHDLETGRTHQPGPARPSWCYGTPAIARAGQLAAIATGNPQQQHAFEEALDRCLSDPLQTNQVTDASLCHGWAGLYQTAWRAARDAGTPALAEHLPHLADALVRHTGTANGPGFLDGAAGPGLALMTAAHDTPPRSGWDTCLLIN